MATQNYTWPAVSVTATNPSVGTNGITAPTSSTEVGGIGLDGNLHSFTTDNSGNQNVNVVSSALPTGSATAANQVLEIAQLTGIHSDTTSLNGKTVHVDTGAVVVASSALPSGASTSALQTSGNSSLSSIDTKTPALGQALAAASTPVVLTAAQLTTLTPLTTVTVIQPTGTNLHAVIDSSALPTGASVSKVDATAFTLGSSSINPVGAYYSSSPDNVPNGDVGSLRMTQTRSLWTSIRDATGVNGADVNINGELKTTVNNITGAVSLPTGAATETSLSLVVTSSQQSANNTAALTLTQGTSIAGSSGPLVQGSVTTAAPTYGNGQVRPLNLNTAGALRVDASGAAISAKAATPTALTVTQAALTVGTSAVRLTVSGSAPSATRVVLVATPDSTATGKFYIGSSSVTATGATRGVQIAAGQVFTANSDAGDYWIISDTAAQIVEVMEQA